MQKLECVQRKLLVHGHLAKIVWIFTYIAFISVLSKAIPQSTHDWLGSLPETPMVLVFATGAWLWAMLLKRFYKTSCPICGGVRTLRLIWMLSYLPEHECGNCKKRFNGGKVVPDA
jgi:hypothetical protein